MEDQADLNFARLNLEPGQLSGEELTLLAKRMTEVDPKETDRLEQEIFAGFAATQR